MPHVAVGRIVGTFGLHGDIKIAASDAGDLIPGTALEVQAADGTRRTVVVVAARAHKRVVVARLEGVTDIAAAHVLVGSALFADAASLPDLPPGTHRDSDLIGLRVVDARLGDLGEVEAVAHYPSADMLVIGDALIPMHSAYDVTIDVAARTISTCLPDGFEELIKGAPAKRGSPHSRGQAAQDAVSDQPLR